MGDIVDIGLQQKHLGIIAGLKQKIPHSNLGFFASFRSRIGRCLLQNKYHFECSAGPIPKRKAGPFVLTKTSGGPSEQIYCKPDSKGILITRSFVK